MLRGIVVLSLTGVLVSAQEDQPSLAEVLKAAGEYVATFERNASLVAEEDYYQFVENNRRTLHSDMMSGSGSGGSDVQFVSVLPGVPDTEIRTS